MLFTLTTVRPRVRCSVAGRATKAGLTPIPSQEECSKSGFGARRSSHALDDWRLRGELMADTPEPTERATMARSERVRAFLSRHKVGAAIGGFIAALASIASIVGVVLPYIRPAPAPERQTDLEIAAFDATKVTRSNEVVYGSLSEPSLVETGESDVATVQIGLRNRGDAPVFLTRAIFTFQAHEPLETCLEIGDAIVVTESVNIDIPLRPSGVPWVHEEPISFRVAPNDVDRLEFTFSVPELPPFVAPAVVSVDVAVRQDLTSDDVAIGTARLVVPATNVAALLPLEEVPLEGVGTEFDHAELRPCIIQNLEAMQAVRSTEALETVVESPEFVEHLEAHEAYRDGHFYVLEES